MRICQPGVFITTPAFSRVSWPWPRLGPGNNSRLRFVTPCSTLETAGTFGAKPIFWPAHYHGFICARWDPVVHAERTLKTHFLVSGAGRWLRLRRALHALGNLPFRLERGHSHPSLHELSNARDCDQVLYTTP